MIWILEDEKPNINLFTCGTIRKDGIKYAYKDLTTAYYGIYDFVDMLDGISEGVYTLSEATIAGLIATNALDGYLIKGDCSDSENWYPAKYIKINGLDTVLLTASHEVLNGNGLAKCEFDGNNGKRYRLSSKKDGGKRNPKKMRIDRANSQPSEDGKPSLHKESLPSSAKKCKNPNTAAAHSRERKMKP